MGELSEQHRRILRQHVATDELLGVTSVPVRPHAGPHVAAPINADDVKAPPAMLSPFDANRPGVPGADGKLPGGDGALPGEAKLAILTAMDQQEVSVCRKCQLCEARTQTVFGEGDPDAAIMFIGEGPGQREDELGRPFVGRAGDLLNKMIEAMGLSRGQVYIANVVKCRPPQNRTPTPHEVDTCWDYLRRQIQTIAPKAIVTLGGPATKKVLETNTGITALRGVWHRIDGLGAGGAAIPVMPTFHPAFLLRQYTPENRKHVWSDLQKVMAAVGLSGSDDSGPSS